MKKGSKRPVDSWAPQRDSANRCKYQRERELVREKEDTERTRTRVINSWGRTVC